MDTAQLESLYRQMVPFATTLGVEYTSLAPERIVLRLPDDKSLHNHLGGPHAGAMFTLGESGSGLVIIANFGEHLGGITPLPGSAEIRYMKVAKGAVSATCTLSRPVDEVLAEVERDGRAAVDIPVSLATDDGTVTGEMTVHWILKRTG